MQRGFTLIELLVVLAVMGSLIGFFGFSFRSSGVELESAQRQILTLIRHARAVAVAEGKETRLTIRSDSNEMDSFYRQIEIVYEGNQSGEWIVVKEGEYLPKGVWVLPQESDLNEYFTLGEDWYPDAFSVWSDEPMSIGIAEGLDMDGQNLTIRPSGFDNEFCYLSFDSSGRLIRGSLEDSPRIVLASGVNSPKADGVFSVGLSDKFMIKGILVQPYGGFLPLDHYDFAEE